MASQLYRPSVEVVQEFRSTSPTIVTPALVPCAVAPYFEVIEVLNADGTANDDAKLEEPYRQLDLLIDQSSFPSPRENIDEVNVDETSIRGFMKFGGSMLEASKTSGFLKIFSQDFQPYVESTSTHASKTAPLTLTGLTLILQQDSHIALTETPGAADFPAASDVTLTFDDDYTLEEVVTFINTALPGTASITGSDPWKLKLASTTYGAGSSIVVRQGGTANTALKFPTDEDEVSVGYGFYAADDADDDTESAKLMVWKGTKQVHLGDAGDQWAAAPQFVDKFVEAGDTFYADGVNIGNVVEVHNAYLVMSVEQSLISEDAAFHPRRVWCKANGLTYPVTGSAQATVTGAAGTAATRAWLVSSKATLSTTITTTDKVVAGQSITVQVTIAGVAQTAETVVVLADWDTLTKAVTGIGTKTTFQAYYSNKFGDEVNSAVATTIGLRTLSDNAGSGASITVTAQSAEMTHLGFTVDSSDVGENVRYLPGTIPLKVSAAAVSSAVSAETVIVTTTVGGAAQSAETITWGASHDELHELVDDWNSQSLWTQAYRATSDGTESGTGTYFAIRTMGENFGTGANIHRAHDTGGTDLLTLPNGTDPGGWDAAGVARVVDGSKLKWSANLSDTVYTAIMVADEDDGGVSLQQAVTRINALYPGLASLSSSDPPALKLTSPKYGEGSEVKIVSQLDGTPVSKDFFFPSVTDDTSYYGSGRPNPDAAIDVDGSLVIQSHVLRDGLTGQPYPGAFAYMYIAYKGLRLDMSPDAENPSLIIWPDTDTIEEVAPPISTDNPGALMSYLMALNSPGMSIASIGVPEVSADAPDGTPVGYASCATFLETEEVYALALATQNPVIHQAFLTHTNFMSEPEEKGERILFFNPEIPTRANPTAVGSGTDANSTGNVAEIELDENLSPALIALGIDPNEDINPESGEILNEVYLDLGTDDHNYLIHSVTNGITVKVRTSFSTGDGNEDAFFSTTALPTNIISDNWTVYKRGAELLIPGSTKPDKQAIAETVQGAAAAYQFRRGFMVFPDQCKINVTGTEQLVEGYYATACVAGMVGRQPPQQPFTNFPISGLTGVVGSNDMFTETQLNIMAAGGVYILVQDTQGAPVICRHQLSTDTTSIEKRELSITKAVDYTAKFVRTGLRNFIGRNNITTTFMDQLSTVVQGLASFLLDGVNCMAGIELNGVSQDPDAPDTVLIDLTLNPLYPCNYIRVTLVI